MKDELLGVVEREELLQPIITVANLSKTYASGLQALKNINLDIRRGQDLKCCRGGKNSTGNPTVHGEASEGGARVEQTTCGTRQTGAP